MDKRKNKNLHVVKGDECWKVKRANAKRSSGNFKTQKGAFEFARNMAKKTGQEVITHNTKGLFRDKRSYGRDPHPPKG